MSIKQPYPLAPTGELDVYWDWTEYLTEVSDTIAGQTVTPGPGITKVSDTQLGSRSRAYMRWTTPPGAGARSYIDCEITTAGGRKSGARRIEIVAVPARGAD